ncbi:MAG: PepSY-like domain-containing protein [Bacteroidota bacterium]
MKKLISLLAAVLITTGLFAQKVAEKDVPPAVLSTFKSKITDSVNVAWTKEGAIYEAAFTKNNMPVEVEIKETSEWVMTEWGIPAEYLPKKIKHHIDSVYAGFKVTETTIAYRTDGNFYVIEVKKKKDVQELTYALTCEFVKSEKIEAEKKEK